MAYPSMWSQKALVTLTKKGGSDINYHCVIETIDIDEGERNITEVSTVCGGRLVKVEPQTMTTVTFEGYPVGIATTQVDSLGFSQQMNGTEDTTQPLSSSPVQDPDLYRVAIMWTNDSTITSAVAAVPSGKEAYRWVGKDAYWTKNPKSFTDKGLKFTVTIKCPIFNKAGVALITEEGSDGSTTMSALSTYS